VGTEDDDLVDIVNMRLCKRLRTEYNRERSKLDRY